MADKPHQAGQSNKVAPHGLRCFGLGKSDAVQQPGRLRHIGTILAVNTDPQAPIFIATTCRHLWRGLTWHNRLNDMGMVWRDISRGVIPDRGHLIRA